MADLWYPGGIDDPAPAACWGSFTDAGEPKFVLHTTEGRLGWYDPDPRRGDVRRYYGNPGNWPNYTLAVAGGRWRVYNHVPANRSAMALRNLPGGVQTNRDNATQVEIATRAAHIGSLPGAALDELARLLAWEHLARGVPLRSTVRWVAYPASYGQGAPQRLPGPAWDAYAGVVGHQHATENDHGDPGLFPITALLDRAAGYLEDDVTPEDRRAIAADVVGQLKPLIPTADAVQRAVLGQLFADVKKAESPGPGGQIRQGSAGQTLGAVYLKAGDVQNLVQYGPGSVSVRIDWLLAAVAALAAAAGVELDPVRPPG